MIDEWRRTMALAALLAGLAAGGHEAAAGGCAVVAEADSGRTLYREGRCEGRVTPASTFKIPIALMGYDAGILDDEHNPRWDYQPGDVVNSERDRGTIDPTTWEAYSVVWYSQRVTLRLGMERFGGYVAAFDYGNRDVTGDPALKDGLTRAWLVSSLQISPDEQIGFLRRFLAGALPVSARAHAMTAAILPEFHTDGGWTVRGKTGGGRVQDAEGRPDPERPLGWFVGWADKDGRRVLFARLLISDGRGETANGVLARQALLSELDRMAAE